MSHCFVRMILDNYIDEFETYDSRYFLRYIFMPSFKCIYDVYIYECICDIYIYKCILYVICVHYI